MSIWMCTNCKSLTGPMAPATCSNCGRSGTFARAEVNMNASDQADESIAPRKLVHDLPQDNEPLREAIIELVSVYGGVKKGPVLTNGEVADAILTLFQAEQTHLKAELIAKLREMLQPKALYVDVDAEVKMIPLGDFTAALDTLERGA